MGMVADKQGEKENQLRSPITASVTHRVRVSPGILSSSRKMAISSGHIPLVRKEQIFGFGKSLR